jgi:general secretion pathway protein H
MLLVVALLAAASLLGMAAMRGGFDGIALRSNAKEIAAQLRYTRAQAIASGKPQRFTLDPRGRRWTAPGGRAGEIPRRLAITFYGAREVQPRAGEGAIVFFADGAATGGRIRLASKRAAWNVDVAWLTGAVKLRRGEVER